MTYTTQSMAAAAEKHYRSADKLCDGDPEMVQASIAESLCGLLAMQLARYADEPHDDFGDDDDDAPLPREESDEDHERAREQQHGKEPEVIDPYSIHRSIERMEAGPDNG